MFELITNRTQSDVDYAENLSKKGWLQMTAEEQAEWLNGLKGAYNHTDLNRVERAVAEISVLFGLNLTTKTDWTAWDIPKQSDLDRFLENIRKIVAKSTTYTDTPTLPQSMSKLTYTSANDIEKILMDISKIEPTLFRCNEAYCGEV
jgi:hypothetical protein